MGRQPLSLSGKDMRPLLGLTELLSPVNSDSWLPAFRKGHILSEGKNRNLFWILKLLWVFNYLISYYDLRLLNLFTLLKLPTRRQWSAAPQSSYVHQKSTNPSWTCLPSFLLSSVPSQTPCLGQKLCLCLCHVLNHLVAPFSPFNLGFQSA